MVHAGVEGRDIREAQLGEGLLQDSDAGSVSGVRRSVGIYGPDDFVDMGRY